MEAGVIGIEALQGKTRVGVAHDAHARAFERVEDLERQLHAAFDELSRSEEQLLKVGVTVNSKFGWLIEEAWAAYRAKLILKKRG